MSLNIKHSSSSSNLDVFSGRCRDIRSVGNATLVNTLSGLDNFIQPRRDLRRWDPTAEDIPSRDRGSVEISIGVLPLNQHRSLQRKPRKQTYNPQRRQINSQLQKYSTGQRPTSTTHLSISSTKTSGRGGPNSPEPLLQSQSAPQRQRCSPRSSCSRPSKTP